jgi:hypothetical protein
MANFDDEFDNAPDASFDDEFDQAPEAPGLLQKLLAKAQSAVTPSEGLIDTVSGIGETAQDFATGTAQGLSMNSLDEIGGLIGAGVETGLGAIGVGPGAVDKELAAQGFQMPEDSFGDKYRTYQQASEQALDEAEERSPIANTVGQIAGGVTGGSVLGAAMGVGKAASGAKTLSQIAQESGKGKAGLELLARAGKGYAKASPAIALESALTSKEQLIGDDANPMGVAADVAGGLAFGAPAMLGITGLSDVVAPAIGKRSAEISKKISDSFASEDHPRLRQMAKAYTEYGKNLGIGPRSHGADISGPKFAQRDQKAVGSVMGSLDEADSKLGQQVGDSLNQATERGAIIDVSPDIQAAADRVSQLAETIPQLGNSRRSAAAYEKILAGEAQLNPLELKTLIDDIDASIGVFKASTNITPQDASTMSELMRFRSSISGTLKKNVPEYRQAAERFENFRQVLEQLISGDKPADVTNKFYGKVRDADNKVFSSLDRLVKNVQRDDAASQPSRTAFVNFMDALEGFEAKEASRLAANPKLQQVAPSASQLRKVILDASDDSVLRGSSRATTQGRALVPDLKEAIIGKAPTAVAYAAGRIVKKTEPVLAKTANIGKAIYNAPAQTLSNLATKLEASGQFKGLGKALSESLKNGNSAKKNAALFTIMQNPDARLFIDAEELENGQDQ